jgi:pSer/pThr/pTyr-binding forkhead associated (FHA) protein
MAKILFVGLDGSEKTHRLQTHRPFTVGRDPGNDFVLRDPKVSRHHAEIVFERGFFVLHDLASANGTYINGKNVKVAPLTHGAQLRMGNTYGRFSEELPTESESEPITEIAEPFDPSPLPSDDLRPFGSLPTEDLTPLAVEPTAHHERLRSATVPHEQLADGNLKKK